MIVFIQKFCDDVGGLMCVIMLRVWVAHRPTHRPQGFQTGEVGFKDLLGKIDHGKKFEDENLVSMLEKIKGKRVHYGCTAPREVRIADWN